MMKKVSTYVITMGLLVILAACNSTDQQARRNANQQKQQLEQVNFEPEDQDQMNSKNNVANRQMSNNEDEKRYSGIYFRSHMKRDANENLNTNENQITDKNRNMDKNKTSTSMADFQRHVVELTNQKRQEQGLPPLDADQELTNVAQTKAEDMANNQYFSHTSPTYGSPFEMMQQFGVDYTTAAENIASGQTSPEEVVTGWMNSEGHRKNILNEKITHIGVGFSENGNYWSQMFIKK